MAQSRNQLKATHGQLILPNIAWLSINNIADDNSDFFSFPVGF